MVEITQADRDEADMLIFDVVKLIDRWEFDGAETQSELASSIVALCLERITDHRTAALTAERDALAAIVEKYARHDGLCGIIGGYGYCTCGLDAARKALHDPT